MHFGKETGSLYVGAFAAAGWFDGYDSDEPMVGHLYGVEAGKTLSNNVFVYAQIGKGEAIGDPGDNEFIGLVGRIGGSYQINDKLRLGGSFETGRSNECFVDCGDQPGQYFGLTVDAQYAIVGQTSLVATLSGLRVEDYDDPDTGTDVSLFLGVRQSFGGSDPLSAMNTPMQMFRAAGYMETLD